MTDGTAEYYLVLLQLQLAVLGVVIAGVIALVQILNAAKPHRDIRLLVRRRILACYGALLAGLLTILALGSWVTAFPRSAALLIGQDAVSFFANGYVALAAMALSVISMAWFVYLVAKTRTLLDSKRYLTAYVKKTRPGQVRHFLATIYSEQAAHDIREGNLNDPFQPIREYIKDNAFKYYDYATADGLRHFSRLFDKTFASIKRNPHGNEYERLARYIGESSVEFFTIFKKAASEKRKTDTITLLASKGELLLTASKGDGLVAIVRSLESITQLADDDEEVIAAIEHIQRLLDNYLALHKKAKWNEIAETFEEVCLSVTRISEHYYLHNSLKTVPVIGYYTGKHRSVTAALVGFFTTYRDLGDRYVDAQPVHYFEAIEGVIEVLFARLSDIIEAGQQNIGFNLKYHDIAHDLYSIYYTFGIDAVEHKKPELLAFSLSNLRRIIKPAKNFRLSGERATIANMFIELTIKGVAAFDDVPIKGERTFSMYARETLGKHATATLIAEAINAARQKDDVNFEASSVRDFLKALSAIKP